MQLVLFFTETYFLLRRGVNVLNLLLGLSVCLITSLLKKLWMNVCEILECNKEQLDFRGDPHTDHYPRILFLLHLFAIRK